MFEQYQRSKSAPYLRFGKRSGSVDQESAASQNIIKKVAGRSKLDSPGFFYPIFVTFRNNL
ncbi:hypothetical protein AAVH_30576 [Aphelenchoides avenae]|nr:hypothetical protein AAVH_30576 [Aphelenchus avenae]